MLTSERLDFTDQEIITRKNIADLEEGLFRAIYIVYNFYTGWGTAYGSFDENVEEVEVEVDFELLDDAREELLNKRKEGIVTAGEVFNKGWYSYSVL